VRRHPLWLLSTVLLSLATSPPAEAQRVLGPWEDATIAPRGMLRAGISTEWSRSNERFRRSGGGVEPLGADFTRDTLGPLDIEALAGLQAQLEALTALPSVPVSLGGLEVRIERTAYTTPITLEFGVTSRLALSAVIPYVKNRVETYVFPNTGRTGNVGVNPALGATAVRTRNTQVVTELQTAATTLQSELARCLNNADPTCAAVNADRAGATALVQAATTAAGSVASVYGSDVVTGALFVPVVGSTVQGAVDTRLMNMSTQFTTFLGAAPTGEWIATRPVSAPPLAYADFQQVLTDPAFGITGRALADVERSHLGDVEIGAKLVLFEPRRAAGVPPATAGLRLSVGALYRLPTAQLDLPEDFADVGTGDAQPDLELRGFLDVLAGRHFWASAVVRYGMQLADEPTLRITDRPDMVFPSDFRTQVVDRDLGEFVEVEVAPRWVPNETFAVSADYRYRSKAADEYGGFTASVVGPVGTPVPLDAATLGMQTAQNEHRFGMAITFSTVRGYARGRSRWPMEVSLLHTQVLGGEGVPKTFATAVAFRFYRRLFGVNQLRGR
jgi:hypothetical protein